MIRLIVVCAAAAVVASLPQERLAAQEPATPSSAVVSVSGPIGGIRLVNRSGTARQIEVRAAVGAGCAAGPVVSRQSIAPGATVVIRSSQPLCLRRPVASGLGAPMTGEWALAPMRRGIIDEVIP